jgi:hypothetical protein
MFNLKLRSHCLLNRKCSWDRTYIRSKDLLICLSLYYFGSFLNKRFSSSPMIISRISRYNVAPFNIAKFLFQIPIFVINEKKLSNFSDLMRRIVAFSFYWIMQGYFCLILKLVLLSFNLKNLRGIHVIYL